MGDEKAGWEVEGFINRLTKRDDTNSERLVLEALSHLRAFSRDCDGLRQTNAELRAEIERLRAAVEDAIDTLEAMDLHVDNPLYERLRTALAGKP